MTSPTAPLAPPGRPLEEGAVLGRFVIVRALGSGSGGVVYAAWDSHLGRRLALKVFESRGGDADESWRRLIHEAQLIARLDHPNVVTVHDVGAIDGRAFIAMELVDGHDLSEAMAQAWDRKPRPTWQQRVASLLLAGDGLAAAHAAHVIHGDFKPANVLVGRDGRVKVSDFGIGILREPENTAEQTLNATAETDVENAEITLGGNLWGTPLYMAPELFQGHRPTEASDVYSYCASLYQALYGEPPATGRGLAALFAAKLDPKPGRAESVPRKLRDLVMRGLDPTPNRRPRSVAKIVATIRALQRRRSRRITVAACIGAAIPMLAAYPLLVSDEEPCIDARAELAGVWDHGRREDVRGAFAAVARADADLQRVQQRLDDYATRWTDARLETCQLTRRGEQSTLLEHRKLACLDERRAELDAFVRVLVRADAEVAEDAADSAASLSPVEDCLDRAAFLDAPTPDVTAVVDRVRGELARARGLRLAGKPAEAQPIVQAAVEDAATIDYAALQADALRQLGLVTSELGDYTSAEKHLTEAVWIAEGAKADDVAALASLDVLELLSRGAGRPKEALAWAPHVQVALRRAGLGADEQASFLLARGHAHSDLFEHDAALEDYAAAEALIGELERDPLLLRAALANARSLIHSARGEHADAARELEGVLDIYESEYGRHHPQVARMLDNVAATYVAVQDFDRALALEEEALAIATTTVGLDHPVAITVMANLAGVLVQQQRLDDAIDMYEDALEAHARVLGREHPQYAGIELNLAGALGMAERFDEAAEAATRGRTLLEQQFGQDHVWVGYALVNEGSARLERGEVELAVALLERANVVLAGEGIDPDKRASAQFALANALVRAGLDRGRAIELMRAASAAFETHGIARPDITEALRELEG